MEKRIENLETNARIKGLPTWHLTGVTSDAVPVIKDSGFWVHYPSFGLDGWYIALPNAVLPLFKAALAKKGVGLEGIEALPTSSKAMYITAGFCLFVGLIGVHAPLAFIALFAGVVAGKISAATFAQYAEMLKPEVKKRMSSGSDTIADEFSLETQRCFAATSGNRLMGYPEDN